ncbi:MAG: SGNH/GDSL hydrolase family protein [Dorea sp.]
MRKIWFAFGDSITDMGYYIDTVVEDTGYQGVKFGYSGYSYGVDHTGFGSLKDVYTDMFRSEQKPDVITIWAGTNDFGHSGTLESMRENMGEIIEGILHQYPDVCLLIITPIKRNYDVQDNPGETTGIGPNSLGLYLGDYVHVIKEVARKYALPILDLYTLEKINMNNAHEYTLDGLHPTPEYGIHLGHTIAEAITLHVL